MKAVMTIGTPPWNRAEIAASIDEFSALYANRPVKNNQGGMKAPHMFGVWFMARQLSPDLIVESGIWKGQSTWLLEHACPNSKLVSIDLNLGQREYVSGRAVYSDKDFSEHDWSDVTDRSLAFFDDHQNAYIRLQQCSWFGFRHAIFDDNYPITQGDCYSLKKAFANAGFEPGDTQGRPADDGIASKILSRLAGLTGRPQSFLAPRSQPAAIPPNHIDSRLLHKHLDVYHEFPPVFKASKTRWGDNWDEDFYPTPEPLLEQPAKPSQDIFLEEAMSYTWICYARLK